MRFWERLGMVSAPLRASALEFQLRFWIHVIIYTLGFWAPWNHWLHLDGVGPNAHVWGTLAVLLSKTGVMGIGTAFEVVLLAGIACALKGAWWRTWGSAYLGVGVMRDDRMHGDVMMADGPYRHVRNPLYLGTFVHTLALALLMPVSGAVFTIGMIGLVQVRLILGEEAFLTEQLGTAYTAYCALVPRLVPSLRARVTGTGVRPQWVQAVLAEVYMWGVAGSFAVLGWRYNANLLTQCVLVSLGVSIVARAFPMKERPAA
jgi:protein-S-isoprenylcysteine O-methyltransferase Ste14